MTINRRLYSDYISKEERAHMLSLIKKDRAVQLDKWVNKTYTGDREALLPLIYEYILDHSTKEEWRKEDWAHDLKKMQFDKQRAMSEIYSWTEEEYLKAFPGEDLPPEGVTTSDDGLWEVHRGDGWVHMNPTGW